MCLFDLCPSDDLSEVLKISVTPTEIVLGLVVTMKYLKICKQVKPWHQMDTHIRNSSIIFKNFCSLKISHHPNRCYIDCLKTAVNTIRNCAYQIGSEQSEQTLSSSKYRNDKN